MTIINLQVGASGDDGSMQSTTNDSGRAVTNDGVVSLTDLALPPGSHSNNDEWCIAARFTGVTIPQGATINSASFQMRAFGTYNASPNTVRFYVSAQASDNAAALAATVGNLATGTRPRSTAFATVTLSSVIDGTWYSVDVTSVVQEIVNRVGWVSGNAIAIQVDTHEDTTLGEWQEFYPYDRDAASAPKLDIDYSASGGGYGALISDARNRLVIT